MTSIEWTQNPDGSPGKTWNPIRGCSMAKGSELKGCLNCYAAAMAARNLPGMRSPTTGEPFARRTKNGPRWTGKVELIPEKLDEPLRWRKPQRVFVNSMSDLFHESLSNEDIAQVFHIMYGEASASPSPEHTYQILTKRPQRMVEWFRWLGAYQGDDATLLALATHRRFQRPHPRVWLGVSVEDQATADERIPLLLQTPAAVRFVSYEPALGPVLFDVSRWGRCYHTGYSGRDREAHHRACECHLDWVIVGGESGPGARPFDVEWARSTVRQCKAAGVAVFVKQLGSWPLMRLGDGRLFNDGKSGTAYLDRCAIGIADRKGGDPAEWPEDLRVREFPKETN